MNSQTVPFIEETVRLALRSSAHCKVMSQDMRLLPELLRCSARQSLAVFNRCCSEHFDYVHSANPAVADGTAVDQPSQLRSAQFHGRATDGLSLRLLSASAGQRLAFLMREAANPDRHAMSFQAGLVSLES